MKRPFDTLVGPGGVWKDEGAADEEETDAVELTAREDFALRCLNAAANLYGVVTMDEFVSIYNGYAKDHDAPVSDAMTVAELDALVDRLFALLDSEPLSMEACLDRPEIWFSTWQLKAGEPRLIVYSDLTAIEDGDNRPDAEKNREIDERIRDTLADFRKLELAVLPEDVFLNYDEPLFAEDTKASLAFIKFIRKEYGLEKEEAELDTLDIQADLRVNGATIATALKYIRHNCEWGPSDHASFGRLMGAVAALVDETRTWDARGRTWTELHELGLDADRAPEELDDIFDLEGRGAPDGEADDWHDDAEDDDDLIYPEDVPYSVYNGPIDFKFVKDPAWRDEKVFRYDDVRQVTMDFIRHHVIRELTPEARKKAAVRLGFLKPEDGLESLDKTLDCVAGDFACMMDDQDGGPAFRRVQASKKDAWGEIDARAASYYANYRYTWLEIQAVKAGVGVKCRDLLTGEDLFLMERSLSLGDVKGMTICVGIAPMEDVYIALGVFAPARFENPATILKIVLTHLGLSAERPIRLGLADQAAFAAETIRRIHANGNFDSVLLGRGDGV